MKLKQACEIAEVCGIDTIYEAVANIFFHAGMFFEYENVNKELEELVKEANKYNMNSSIYVVLKGENENERI